MPAVEVNYRVIGQGPAVYFIHGIGARSTTWDGLIGELKNHYTCISYDLRGHGHSPQPPLPYTLADMVADLEALRAKLGHAQIHVLGHSLGGQIGPAYARAYPERVLSLGLLSTAAARTAQDRAKLQAVGEAMRADGVAAVVDTLLARWYTEAFMQAHPARVAARVAQVKDTPPAVFLSVFWIYARTEMVDWLAEVTCPCLVLTGALDAACSPRLNRIIAATLPQAELVILEGLKHSILVEAPERVLPHVKRFLRNVSE